LHLEPIEGLLPYPHGSLLLNLSFFGKFGPYPMNGLCLGVIGLYVFKVEVSPSAIEFLNDYQPPRMEGNELRLVHNLYRLESIAKPVGESYLDLLPACPFHEFSEESKFLVALVVELSVRINFLQAILKLSSVDQRELIKEQTGSYNFHMLGILDLDPSPLLI
jgi:hypothetical protein